MGIKEMCDGCGKIVYDDTDGIRHTLSDFRRLNYNYTKKTNKGETIVISESVVICDACWTLIRAILKLKNDA